MAKTKGTRTTFHKTDKINIYYENGFLIKEEDGEMTVNIALGQEAEQTLKSVVRQINKWLDDVHG